MGSSKKKATEQDKISAELQELAKELNISDFHSPQELTRLYETYMLHKKQKILLASGVPFNVAKKADELKRDLFDEKNVQSLQETLAQNGFEDDFISSFTDKIVRAFAARRLPHLESTLPSNHVIPNNKLANIMTAGNDIFCAEGIDINVGTPKKPVITNCILAFDENSPAIKNGESFSEYDRNVMNALVSLFLAGVKQPTIPVIYRAMNGLSNSESPTTKQCESIIESIEKMRSIKIKIDFTNELNARGYTLNGQRLTRGEIDTRLLVASSLYIEGGGLSVLAYNIVEQPVLYTYASLSKQVITVSSSTLEIREVNGNGSLGAHIPNTVARIGLRGYLIRRIEGMKGDNKLKSNVVKLYSYTKGNNFHRGLYEAAGYHNPTREEMRRVRIDVERILLYWKHIGYITEFEKVVERNKITGYKITP